MFNRFSLIYLLCVIKTLHSHMYYDPEFFHGRDEVSTLYNNLPVRVDDEARQLSIESYTALQAPTASTRRGIVRRSMESSTESSDKITTLADCIPITTTASSPVKFFFTLGSNPFANGDRKESEEYRSKEDNDKRDEVLYDVRQPCDYYPHTHTTPKFPFQGGLNFGSTDLHNPFVPSGDNKPNGFNDFFKPKDNNPLFRGGVVIGNVPNNPFIPTTTEKLETKRKKDSATNKAKYWCTEYQTRCKSREDVTELKPRIIGGRPASPRDHTHMVMIGYGSADDKRWLCGGSLISSKFVLSAAHCTTPNKWGKPKWARLGDLDLSSRTEDASPQERLIIQHYNHPDYKEPAVYHDIAIYKLDDEVTMNDWISPICLHTTNDIPVSQVVVTGWGRIDFASATSPVLMEVEIGLYNDSECKKLMDKNGGNRLPRGIDSRIMVCAGVSQGGKDACTGDSGGPLIIETSKCSKIQIGITSIGRDCGLPDSPGVYTRISHYIPWIESIVWSD